MEPIIYHFAKPQYRNTLYLDKDGVLNTAFYRSNKLSSPRNLDEVNIKQDIEDILIFSKKKKFNLVVISNQPDISRKLITKEFINENLEIIRVHLPISIAIVCPHLKESNCLCRKPNTGMIKKFRELFPDNHESEIFVGDQISDQECADELNIHFIKVDDPTSLKNNLDFTY